MPGRFRLFGRRTEPVLVSLRSRVNLDSEPARLRDGEVEGEAPGLVSGSCAGCVVAV